MFTLIQKIFKAVEFKILFIIGDALKSGDIADRANRCATDFAHSFGDFICRAKELVCMVVQQ